MLKMDSVHDALSAETFKTNPEICGLTKRSEI